MCFLLSIFLFSTFFRMCVVAALHWVGPEWIVVSYEAVARESGIGKL
jgi:hypothetical protein